MDNVTVVMIAFQNFYNKFVLQAERENNFKDQKSREKFITYSSHPPLYRKPKDKNIQTDSDFKKDTESSLSNEKETNSFIA
jgi:hypothetical protein